VDYSGKRIKFEQAKTKGHSKNSIVIIPLSQTLLQLIGEKPKQDDYIFHLPSHTGCLKALRTWIKRAGIDKHITWHCARHSFAVNLLGECQTDIKTVASLLGHSGLKHTEKYTRAVDALKEKAVNALPEINIDLNIQDHE
jgi:integrase